MMKISVAKLTTYRIAKTDMVDMLPPGLVFTKPYEFEFSKH